MANQGENLGTGDGAGSDTSAEYTPNVTNIKMIHINAQSLRNKIDSLEMEAAGADLIAVTETWMEPSI